MPVGLRNIAKSLIKKMPTPMLHFLASPLDVYSGGVPQRISIPLNFEASRNEPLNFNGLFNATGRGVGQIQEGYWNGIDKVGAHSIGGWVPYIQGNTKLCIYNFFSLNYGVRKQLLGHVVLINNKKFVSCFRFTLPSSNFLVMDLQEIFGDQEGDVVFVELYHPRIPKDHAGHDGNLRYWGIYGGHRAICHSMPYPMVQRPVRKRSCRGTMPAVSQGEMKTQIVHSELKSSIPSGLSHYDEPVPFGYFVSSDQQGPFAVWHSAEYTGLKNVNEKHRVQLIALPPIQDVDVQMSFIEAINSGTNVRFKLYGLDKVLLGEADRNVMPTTVVRASELFPKTGLSGTQLVAELVDPDNVIHSGHIHLIYYVANKPGDCVHSHKLDAPGALGSNVVQGTTNNKGSGQSLKFMYYPVAGDFVSWFVVWTIDTVVPAKIQIIDGQGREFIQNIEIPASGICCINLNELTAKLAGEPTGNYVAQLRSDFADLNASLFTASTSLGSISVDHVTGG